LVKDEDEEPAPEATRKSWSTPGQRLLIGKAPFGNVLRLSPMLNISKADVDEGVHLLISL